MKEISRPWSDKISGVLQDFKWKATDHGVATKKIYKLVDTLAKSVNVETLEMVRSCTDSYYRVSTMSIT